MVIMQQLPEITVAPLITEHPTEKLICRISRIAVYVMYVRWCGRDAQRWAFLSRYTDIALISHCLFLHKSFSFIDSGFLLFPLFSIGISFLFFRTIF